MHDSLIRSIFVTLILILGMNHRIAAADGKKPNIILADNV